MHLALSPYAAALAAHAARLRDPAVQARIAEADKLLRDWHAERAALSPPPSASAEAVLADMARVIAAA